ncbi:MAG: polysaccharide deacetylase family protein [bacterium]
MKFLKLLFIAIFLSTALPLFALSADENYINVLCYHRFKERKLSEVKNKQLGDIYSITPRLFEAHMQFLKDNGYKVISMTQYLRIVEAKEEIPVKTVVISIDDGYKSVKEQAYPILKKFNYPSIAFLYSNFLPGGRNALTTEDVKELLSEGLMEFGSHSQTHPILTKRGKMTDEQYCDFLINEIINSKKYLEKKLGVTIDTIGYPYGAYSKEIEKVLAYAGYKAGFSVVPSYNTKETDRYALKRTMIYNSTTVEKLKAILEIKPIKIKAIYPQDGDIITDAMPVLKAIIQEDAEINTATIKFTMGRVVLKDSVYDSKTKTLSYEYNKPLSKGVHIAGIKAIDMSGFDHEYEWLIIVGKPIAKGVLEKALLNSMVVKEK